MAVAKKKPARKKATAKKSPAKKATTRKTTARKTTTRKTTAKKTVKKAATVKKAVTKKAAVKKTVKKAAPKKKVAPKKAATKRKPNAAFMRPMELSAELQAIVGKKPIPRTQVTKKLWEYIKKHDLQNPENRREIIADEKLKGIFGKKKKVSMFEMTKLVSKHMS
jgi:chromatin remodeling complex protein RSC6